MIYINFFVFLAVFVVALTRNSNFNTILVGLTYLAPLFPFGINPENVERFLLVSYFNLIFGFIEIVVFVITVKPGDTPFDKEHLKQLFGHALPIVVALLGLSFLGRSTEIPVSAIELGVIIALFVFGSVMRIVAICQIGAAAFKFDIIFREKQKLKTDQLYGLMRHPSYTAMMIVVVSYAVITHSLFFGVFGVLSAWMGFQYRIYHEERGLADQFGEEYEVFRSSRGMWIPYLNKRKL
ncbi:MAG: isoprenylcysteine carboxylmethyltransferase family protein [Nitrospinales bacterium]|nr:isoprenylcysteine carboxylmethyltransferase family protein [Nitrospinales bacterium]